MYHRVLEARQSDGFFRVEDARFRVVWRLGVTGQDYMNVEIGQGEASKGDINQKDF